MHVSAESLLNHKSSRAPDGPLVTHFCWARISHAPPCEVAKGFGRRCTDRLRGTHQKGRRPLALATTHLQRWFVALSQGAF